VFKKANNAFWNGEYEAAKNGYEKLEELGVRDPVLSYNLGTAYARLGKLGVAVRHFERALRLDPGQDDTRHNLSAIREFIARRASEGGRDADLAPAAGPWRAVLDRFSSRGAAIAFLVFHIALFMVLGIRRFVFAEMPRLSLGVLAGVLIILTLSTGAVALGKWHQDNYVKEAVVVAEEQLDVMEGPSSTVMRFALEEGSRVEILEETATWLRILDSEGRDGWVPAEALGRI
jgi:tetratricopeptide (TPR) repeat protein